MKTYQNTQLGWLIITILLICTLVPIPSYIYQWGNQPLHQYELFGLTSTFIIIFALFFRMKTTIDDKYIIISYGIGLIRKKIQLEEIATTRIVRSAWYQGIGIRYIPNGMIYSINGYDAVELSLKNKNRIIRIGSNECIQLKAEIDKRIQIAC